MEAPSRKVTPLWVEHIYPWLVGMFVCGLGVGAHFSHIALPSSENFFSAVVSLGGILTGFMATLKAMLSGIEAQAFRHLKNSGYLNDLDHYLSIALWSSLSLCVLAIAGFFGVSGNFFFESVLLGAFALALCSVHRVATIGSNLMMSRRD